MVENETGSPHGGRQPVTPATPLHRHILMAWLRYGRISSQAFKLSQSDRRDAAEQGTIPAISVDHGDLLSPQEAHRLRRIRGMRSDGIATITGRHCFDAGLSPIHDAAGTPEHVSIPIPQDWPGGRQRATARRLAGQAEITVTPHPH